MKPLLFLDVDGVLNNHVKHPNGYCGIIPECVYRLNRIVAETGADIVVSSAWRYLINNGDMTCRGFKNMLMTYGLDFLVEIAGTTASDVDIVGRGPQIDECLRGLSAYPNRGNWKLYCPRYVVLDDGSDEPPRPPETMTLTESLRLYHADRWVQTKSDQGLTEFDMHFAIELLGRKEDQ